MIDYYLRADSREALDAALEAAALARGEHTLISRIGSIGADQRYHLNLRLLLEPEPEQLEALASAIIDPPPVSPFRVWA